MNEGQKVTHVKERKGEKYKYMSLGKGRHALPIR